MVKLKQRIPALAIALAIVLAFVVGGIPARAATDYAYDVASKTLTIYTNAGVEWDSVGRAPSATHWRNDGNFTADDVEHIVIADGVSTIDTSAFYQCQNLRTADLPASLTSIVGNAFSGCPNLTTVNLSVCTNLTTIGGNAFNNCTSLDTVDFSRCTLLTTINQSTFENCTNLATVKFPPNLVEIGTRAFGTCPSLVTVVLPDSVKKIGGAFYDCQNLETVVLSVSIEEIGSGAFYDCIKLNSLTFRGSTPPTVGSGPYNAFGSVPDVATSVIHCPESAIDDYKQFRDTYLSNWDVLAIPTPPPTGGGNSPVPPIDETVKPGTDKPEEKPEVTEPEVTEPVTPTLPTEPQTAKPMTNLVIVDGVEYAVASYNINDNNYFKLRDVAAALNGTKKPFEVVYNPPTIELTSGAKYTAVGGELTGKAATESTIANPTDNRILLDGNEVNFTAYNVKDNNYFKLRDIAEAFDFSVVWEKSTGNIIVDTSKGYTA